MLNISQNKGSQTLKFGQVIEYNNRNTVIQNHAEKEAEGLVLDLFLFSKRALYGVKANGLQLSFITFDGPQLGKQLKRNI